MYLVYRNDGTPYVSRRVYVALHDNATFALAEATRRTREEGKRYRIRERLSWPLRMSAAIACGQEFVPNRMEQSDCRI